MPDNVEDCYGTLSGLPSEPSPVTSRVARRGREKERNKMMDLRVMEVRMAQDADGKRVRGKWLGDWKRCVAGPGPSR